MTELLVHSNIFNYYLKATANLSLTKGQLLVLLINYFVS